MQKTSKWQTHVPYLHLGTTIKTQKIYNQHADAILGHRACYAHALNVVERDLDHLKWDTVPTSRQKIKFAKKNWLHDQ